jgi:hypothetical protein
MQLKPAVVTVADTETAAAVDTAAAAEATVVRNAKCMMSFATAAVSPPRFPLSPMAANLFIAGIASKPAAPIKARLHGQE